MVASISVPFFSTNGSSFVEMFVGVGAARIRDLFEQAAKQAPSLIFIDELDALGKARAANPLGTNDEREQTLNQLLSEMDARLGISKDMKPGEELELPLLITAPIAPGEYILEVDMVHEQVSWFNEKGSPTARTKVSVVR